MAFGCFWSLVPTENAYQWPIEFSDSSKLMNYQQGTDLSSRKNAGARLIVFLVFFFSATNHMSLVAGHLKTSQFPVILNLDIHSLFFIIFWKFSIVLGYSIYINLGFLVSFSHVFPACLPTFRWSGAADPGDALPRWA